MIESRVAKSNSSIIIGNLVYLSCIYHRHHCNNKMYIQCIYPIPLVIILLSNILEHNFEVIPLFKHVNGVTIYSEWFFIFMNVMRKF